MHMYLLVHKYSQPVWWYRGQGVVTSTLEVESQSIPMMDFSESQILPFISKKVCAFSMLRISGQYHGFEVHIKLLILYPHCEQFRKRETTHVWTSMGCSNLSASGKCPLLGGRLHLLNNLYNFLFVIYINSIIFLILI